MKNAKLINLVAAVGLTFSLAACDHMSTRDQRMLSGAAIGAGGGALIGAVTGGHALTGAAIGAGAGAVGGYVYDKHERREGE